MSTFGNFKEIGAFLLKAGNIEMHAKVLELGVPRSIHLSHAALTERFKDLVMTEGLADQDDGFLSEGTRQDCSRKVGAAYRGEARPQVG